jgi:hypothetical protein
MQRKQDIIWLLLDLVNEACEQGKISITEREMILNFIDGAN